MPRRVVVTGMGAVCAAGKSLPLIMRSLYAGRRNPAAPTNIRVALDTTYPVFEVSGSLDEAYRTALECEPNRTTQLALIAIEEALQQAGLEQGVLQSRRVGVCMGTTVGCTLNDEPFYRDFREHRRSNS